MFTLIYHHLLWMCETHLKKLRSNKSKGYLLLSLSGKKWHSVKHSDDPLWVPGRGPELCDVGPRSTEGGRLKSLLQLCLLAHEKRWRCWTLKIKAEHPFISHPAARDVGWIATAQPWLLSSRVPWSFQVFLSAPPRGGEGRNLRT